MIVRESDLTDFAAAYDAGAYVVDCREPAEFAAGHVPGATLIPLDDLPHRHHEVPRDRPVYVICATGNRSLTAAAWLSKAGATAISVAGGTYGWVQMGRPVLPEAEVGA